MQIFYLLLLVGGTAVYFFTYSHLVPNRVIGPEHVYLPYVLLGAVLYSFYKASFSNPGIITTSSMRRLDHHAYDGLFYVKADCSTCKRRKIARSKHCAMCGVCVARFDHHCPWINNCVGELNYRYFLYFLVMTLMYLVYGTVVIFGILYSEVLGTGVLKRGYFLNKYSGEKVGFSYTVLGQYLMYNYGVLCMLFMLCAVMGCVLFGFIGYHVYLVAVGKTTNETAKWDDLAYYYKNRERLINRNRERVEKMKQEGKTVRNLKPSEFLDPDKAPSFQSRMATEFPELPPPNMYNYGIIENFSRILLPERYFKN